MLSNEDGTEQDKIQQEAQLPQRNRATPRTHFMRDRQMDGQKAVARTRYAVCVTSKKGLRTKKPTENIGDQRSYIVGDHRMQVFYLYNGRTKQTIRNNISISRHILYKQLEMWANAHCDGRPAEYRWRPLYSAAVWVCSNAAKTRNPLKFVGVPQTNETISAVSEPKFTIL